MSNHVIPAMTDPLGKYWRQPSRDAIVIEGGNAWMSEATFQQLSEYSTTHPTGVYPGKMWRRHDGIFDKKCPPERRRWLLCWYGNDFGGQCEICFLEVILT